jgi:hypothetical protein
MIRFFWQAQYMNTHSNQQPTRSMRRISGLAFGAAAIVVQALMAWRRFFVEGSEEKALGELFDECKAVENLPLHDGLLVSAVVIAKE